ncbi:unnamed protein product [Rhodiola kirilowii]
MRREHSGTFGSPPGNDLAYSTPRSVYLSDNDDDHDACSQTGEEFSTKFMRDRPSPLRIPVLRYIDQMSPHGAMHEDLDRTFGYAGQRENFVLMDNMNRRQWESNANEGLYGNGPDEYHQYPQQTTTPFHVMGSPTSHYAYKTDKAKSSFTPKMKLLCSFGGRILPRPTDGKLRYVGGETRIISIRKIYSFAELVIKTYDIFNQPHVIKYQLPGEDLDSLISVSSDEDLQHMIEEHLEISQVEGCRKLRVFLIPLGESESSHSFESKHTPQNSDCQYVVAVNGVLDRSPRKSSSNQSIPSQLGNYPDYTSGVHREAHIPHLSISPQTPTKTVYHSPPLSPSALEHRDSRKSHTYFHKEHSFADALENVSPRIFNQHAYGDSYFMDATGLCYNKNHAPQKMLDSHLQNLQSFENMEFRRPHEVQFHDLSPHRDFMQYTSHFQRPVLPERELHSCSKDTRGLYSEFNDEHGSNGQIADPGLLHHGDTSSDYVEKQHLPDYSQEFEAEKSPSLALSSISDDSGQHHDISDKKHASNATTYNEEQFVTLAPGSPYNGYLSQDPAINAASSEEVFHTKESFPLLCSNRHEVKKDYLIEDENLGSHSEDTKISQPQSSNDWHSHTILSATRINDETGSELPDEPVPLNAVPFAHKLTAGGTSSREPFTNSASESKYEDTKDEEKNESFSDAAVAEIEAGVYGLQIIKHNDLEELHELGSGTFGTVYHGKWRGTDVAIKRIKRSCFAGKASEQERLTKDFWREAQILSKLHHPNVLAFYGVVPDGPGGTLATVTEYMVTGSLKQALTRKDRALDRRRKLLIATDAACGMEYLHLKNIVHFDLKCDNLLVNLRDPQRPICKVGDFGLSRIKRNTLITGGVRGTLPWMAPELLNDSSNKVSEKVDVFSFGVALWELLTGEEPYAGMHCGAIIGGIVSNTLRPVIPQRCDPEWKALLEECWSADPATRPTFTVIAQRLRNMSKKLETKPNRLHTNVQL